MSSTDRSIYWSINGGVHRFWQRCDTEGGSTNGTSFRFSPHALQKYGSAWITLPNSYYDPEKGRQYYHQFFDQLEFADRLGFDGVCVNEHHQTAYGNIPSPNVMAALLARHIKNGKIAIVGNAISLHAIPQRVPKAVQIPWNLPPKTDTRSCKLLPPLKIWKGPLIVFGRRP